MLRAGPAISLKVLVYLASLAPRRRLVDGKLHRMRIVRHDDAHQRAVLGGNVFVVECDVAMEAEDVRVVVGPVLHFSLFDVAHDVVDAENAAVVSCDGRCHEAGHKRPIVAFVRDQRVDGVAISVHRRAADCAMLVYLVVRLGDRLCAAANGFGKGLIGVVHFKGDVAHAVPMPANMLGGLIVRSQRRGQKKICLALAHRIGCALSLAGLQSAVCDLRKAESLAVKIGCLAGIAHPELDVVNALEFDGVLHSSFLAINVTHLRAIRTLRDFLNQSLSLA